MKDSLVSIIMPTYNWKEKWISLAIDSVLSQSYSDVELIIINDASTNNVEETILSYMQKDKRIIYLKNDENKERSISKNRWILASIWKYVAFLDDDDIWTDPTKLEKQIHFLEKNIEYWLCWCSVHIINEYWVLENKVSMRETDKEIREHLLQFNQLAQSAIVIRKDIFAFSWLFLNTWTFSEDAELWLRIGKYTKLYNLQNTYIEYRNRLDNTSNRNKIKLQWYGFIAMCMHGKNYPNLIKSFVLRLWLIVLTIFWYKYKA